MEFIAAKCPSCQGELQVPDDKDFVKCMYCGVEVKVRDAVKISLDVNIPNMLKLGKEAIKSGNYSEANDYFTKALESEFENSEAWFGKALSCGLSTNLAEVKIKEMLIYFENSLKFCPEEKQENFRLTVSNEIFGISTAYYNNARKHMQEFISDEQTWPEYLQHCRNTIYAMECAGSYDSKNENIVKWIAAVCNENISGYSYSENVFVNGAYRKTGYLKQVPKDFRSELQEKIKVCNEKLKALNPQKWEEEKRISDARASNAKTANKVIVLSILTGLVLGIIISAVIKDSSATCGIIFGSVFLGIVTGVIIARVKRKPIPEKY